MKGNQRGWFGLGLAAVLLLAACNGPYDFNRDGSADFAWVDDHTGEYWRVGEDEPFWSPQLTASAGPGFLPAPGRFADRTVWDPGVLSAEGWESEFSDLYTDYPDISTLGWPHPVARDYTGDGTMERALWDPDTATWHIEGQDPVTFGVAYPWGHHCRDVNDLPAPGDFNGDGTATLAVFRPTDRRFHFADGTSSDPFPLGLPVVADFSGDGTDELAVFSQEHHTWHFADGTAVAVPGDGRFLPAPADYNGDGSADVVAFDTDSGRWLGADGSVLAEDTRATNVWTPMATSIPGGTIWHRLASHWIETLDDEAFDDEFGHC
jgi:hypothetical protein